MAYDAVNWSINAAAAAVPEPEPASLLLTGLALVGLLVSRRRAPT